MRKRKLLPLFILFVLAVCTVSANAAFTPDFEVKSKAAYLVNLDTGTVMYGKNADQKMYPASTTKIMSYIVTMEHVGDVDNERITYTEEMRDTLIGTDSSVANLEPGDVLTVHQMLYAMMVPSGNDAALALAYYVGGGDPQKFVDMMNEKAQELGLKNTHFMNPHGLQDEDHYTTPEDLAVIAQYAMKLNYFMEITNTLRYTWQMAGGPNEGQTVWVDTTNNLINPNYQGGYYYYQYARGIKTGHTDEAGYCLVSSAIAEGNSYLCVVMGAEDAGYDSESGYPIRNEMIDSKSLYRWAFKNFQVKKVIADSEAFLEVPLDFAYNKDHLILMPEKTIYAVLPNEVDVSSVDIQKDLPKSVEAPVKKGDVVGTATLTYATEPIGTVNLIAGETVDRSELVHITTMAKNIFSSQWFLIIAAVIVLLVLIYCILSIKNRRKDKRKKVKRYRDM